MAAGDAGRPAPKAGDKPRRYILLPHKGQDDGHKNGPLDPNSYIAQDVPFPLTCPSMYVEKEHCR